MLFYSSAFELDELDGEGDDAAYDPNIGSFCRTVSLTIPSIVFCFVLDRPIWR
jgi:hypothetical protein